MPENEIFKFLKTNNLTDKDEKTFLTEYSDSSKAKELHTFMQSNDLTDKDFNSFYDTYLKKKGDTPSQSLVTPYPSPLQETNKLATGEILSDISKGVSKQEALTQEEKPKQKKQEHYGQFIDIGVPVGQKIDKLKSVVPESKPMSWERAAVERGQIQGKVANILHTGKRPSIEELGEIADLQKQAQSFPQTEAEKLYGEEGFGMFKKNPLLGVEFVAETLLSSLSALAESGKRTVPMAIGMGAAMGAPIAGIGGVVGAGTGLTAGLTAAGMNLSTSQDILNSLSENGVDISDKDSLVKAFSDEKRMDKIRTTALKYGVPIAIFDVFSAGLGGKLIAGAAGKSIAKKALAGLGEAAIQSFAGSLGELSGQIASGKKVDWNDVAMEGFASLATDVPDVAIGVIRERAKTSSNNKTIANQVSILGPEVGAEDAIRNLNRDLANGVITPQEHQEGVSFVEKAVGINSKIPENVIGENRAKSIELIDERDRLTEEINQREEQKKGIDVAYHKVIDDTNKDVKKRIDEINNKIIELSTELPKESIESKKADIENNKKKSIDSIEIDESNNVSYIGVDGDIVKQTFVKSATHEQIKQHIIRDLGLEYGWELKELERINAKSTPIQAPIIKGEEEVISKPIELSTELPKVEISKSETLPALRDVESTAKAFEEGNKIQWNVFGNEESGEWTVGEKTKTRGGKDAVVLRKVYVEASSDGKSYTKEYADANGIKYDNERTVEHIVPLEDLKSESLVSKEQAPTEIPSVEEEVKVGGDIVKIENILNIPTEEANVLSMLYESKLLTPAEKKILYKQYKNGVMSEKDVSKYTNIDVADLQNGNTKWAQVISDKTKGRKIEADDIDFEEVKPKQEIVETPKIGKNAVQKPSAKSVLQPAQAGVGEAGGKREGVEPSKQGQKPAEKTVTKEQAKIDEEKKRLEITSVYVAPFFDAMVGSMSEVKDIEKSPAYKRYVETIFKVADLLGLKIVDNNANLGDYLNNYGTKVSEISTLILLNTKDISKATEFAAMMGALAPEVQESTIASAYLTEEEGDRGEHDGMLHEIKTPNLAGAVKILNDLGLNHTVVIKKNVIELLEFNKEWFNATEFKEKLNKFVKLLKENNITYEPYSHPIKSNLIESGSDPESEFSRRRILEDIRVKADLQPGGEQLRDAVSEAIKRNEDFIRQEKLASERKEYGDLRKKQIDLNEKGQELDDAELKKLTELYDTLLPVAEETITNAKDQYEEAKAEIDAVAAKVVGDRGFVASFPIKRATRAAVKIMRWYNGKAQWIGDGARSTVIVKSDKDIPAIYKELQGKYPGASIRVETSDTDLGYPKRLLEVRTSNGKIAEFQIMTTEGYSAKDGIKGFPENKQSIAQKAVDAVRKKLGWKIPDGVGHYFYEIERDFNVPTGIREEAKRISRLYYDAFLNPESKLSSEDFFNSVEAFKNDVDAADKSKWDKGNEGNAPAQLTEFLKENKTDEEVNSIKQVVSAVVSRVKSGLKRINPLSDVVVLKADDFDAALKDALQNGGVNLQAWGGFEKKGFEETQEWQNLIKEGKVKLNVDIKVIAGKSVVIINPDNMMTGSVIDSKGNDILNGQGGINFVSLFGHVWATSDKRSSDMLINKINNAFEMNKKKFGDGNIHVVVTKGTVPKLLTSHTGAKGAMKVIENIVDKGFIKTSDFRKALIEVGRMIDTDKKSPTYGKPKYGIDFSGKMSSKDIHSDIEKKFFGVADSTFSKRGFFVQDIVNNLAEKFTRESKEAKEFYESQEPKSEEKKAAKKAYENVKENENKRLDGIREVLNSKEATGKTISFSYTGISEAIGMLFSDNITIGAKDSEAYATIEINSKVEALKMEGGHESYPFHIVQENGERPILNILAGNNHITDIVNDSRNLPVEKRILAVDEKGNPKLDKQGKQIVESGSGKLGSNQIGVADAIGKPVEKMPSNVNLMTDKSGKVYGFEQNGKVFINEKYSNANTPFHEAGHVWINWAKENRQDLYEQGMAKTENSPYLMDVKANPTYQENAAKLPEVEREDYFRMEALAKAIGDNGERFVTESKKSDFRKWLSGLWDSIAVHFGIKNKTATEISNMTLDEFSKAIVSDIVSEKMVSGETVQDKYEEITERAFSVRSKKMANLVESNFDEILRQLIENNKIEKLC
jgi:hypothetical protein